MGKEKNDSSWETLKKVWQIIDAYRLLLVGSLVLAGASVALQLYVPILFGQAIDGIAGPGKVDFALVKGYTFQILVLVVLSSLATWAMNLINNKLAFNTVRDIRSRAIRQRRSRRRTSLSHPNKMICRCPIPESRGLQRPGPHRIHLAQKGQREGKPE